MTEEQYCHEALKRLQEEYKRSAQPYIDRLIAIKSIDVGPGFFMESCRLTPEIISMLKGTP